MSRPDFLTGAYWDGTVIEGSTWRLNRADVARFAAVVLLGVGLVVAGAPGSGAEQGPSPAPPAPTSAPLH